ncbi:MAG: hypothetical protein ACREGC_02845, partial [Minisyncoccia bacterium]
VKAGNYFELNKSQRERLNSYQKTDNAPIIEVPENVPNKIIDKSPVELLLETELEGKTVEELEEIEARCIKLLTPELDQKQYTALDEMINEITDLINSKNGHIETQASDKEQAIADLEKIIAEASVKLAKIEDEERSEAEEAAARPDNKSFWGRIFNRITGEN